MELARRNSTQCSDSGGLGYTTMERCDDLEAAETSGCNPNTSLNTVHPEVAVGTTHPNNVDIGGNNVILFSDFHLKMLKLYLNT